jgi:IS4 transposase
VVGRGADVCMRLNPTALPVMDDRGRAFPLLEKIRTLRKAGETADWQVWVQSSAGEIAGRLCAIRKSEEAIERAQRKLVVKQQNGQGKITPQKQEYACYVVVYTTLPTRRATAMQVLECYRLRWQIELTFKRLKSIVQLGHIPKQDDQSSRAWLYGKLFVALLSQKLIRIGSTISPWGYYPVRQTSDSE